MFLDDISKLGTIKFWGSSQTFPENADTRLTLTVPTGKYILIHSGFGGVSNASISYARFIIQFSGVDYKYDVRFDNNYSVIIRDPIYLNPNDGIKLSVVSGAGVTGDMMVQIFYSMFDRDILG